MIIPDWTVLANPSDMFLYVLLFWMPLGVSKKIIIMLKKIKALC